MDAAPREDGEPTAPLRSEQAADGIDLTSCHAVRFDMQEETPGLQFTSATGEDGWTPVVKHRKKESSVQVYYKGGLRV